MFNWLFNSDTKVKPKNLITVNRYVTEDGKEDISIFIDPSVTPTQYINSVYNFMGKESLLLACDLLEMNGHKDVFTEIQKAIIEKYVEILTSVAVNVPKQDNSLDIELVKPSKGILNE